jgi:hypothetical protein
MKLDPAKESPLGLKKSSAYDKNFKDGCKDFPQHGSLFSNAVSVGFRIGWNGWMKNVKDAAARIFLSRPKIMGENAKHASTTVEAVKSVLDDIAR